MPTPTRAMQQNDKYRISEEEIISRNCPFADRLGLSGTFLPIFPLHLRLHLHDHIPHFRELHSYLSNLAPSIHAPKTDVLLRFCTCFRFLGYFVVYVGIMAGFGTTCCEDR